MAHFRIQETDFDAPLNVGSGGFMIKSSPRPYNVEFLSREPLAAAIDKKIAGCGHPLVLADKRVIDLHLKRAPSLSRTPILPLEAAEEVKTMDGVMRLIEFLQREKATRSSMLFVIGGGIIQDVGAFGAAMYKRGIPWTYVPTTLLAQGDSGVGGKTGLNYQQTKNLLALFSAPRELLIHTGFLATLSQEDLLSGLGETFRLCITGGPEFIGYLEQRIDRAVKNDSIVLTELIEASLSVKRAVVEYDEFEIDIRRSMNLGHSVGHAFEAITNHDIPHGIGVTVGLAVESEISYRRGLLSDAEQQRVLHLAKRLVNDRVRGVLRSIDMKGILEVLRRDKKTEGSVLKLVVVERIGQIRFIDLELEDETVTLLQDSLRQVLEAL